MLRGELQMQVAPRQQYNELALCTAVFDNVIPIGFDNVTQVVQNGMTYGHKGK